MAALAAQGGQKGGEDLPGVVMGGAVGGLPSHHRQVDGLVGGEGQGAFCGLGQGRGRLPPLQPASVRRRDSARDRTIPRGRFMGHSPFVVPWYGGRG